MTEGEEKGERARGVLVSNGWAKTRARSPTRCVLYMPCVVVVVSTTRQRGKMGHKPCVMKMARAEEKSTMKRSTALAHLIFTFSPLLACVWRTVHASTTFRSSWPSRHELSSSWMVAGPLLFLLKAHHIPSFSPPKSRSFHVLPRGLAPTHATLIMVRTGIVGHYFPFRLTS